MMFFFIILTYILFELNIRLGIWTAYPVSNHPCTWPHFSLKQNKTIAYIHTHICIGLLVLHEAKRPLWWPYLNVRELRFGRSTPRFASRYTPLVLTSCGQDECKFGNLPLDLLADLPPQYWHLVVKMSANLADLPLDLLADLPPQYWHLVVKMSANLADLPLDLLADLPPSTDILWSRWVQIWQIYP